MTVRIIRGNCMDIMPTLEAQSMHCCVTSPPYWGLRDYGTEPVEWPAIDYAPLAGLGPIVQIPAMRSSLGLEPTIEAFIGHMVLVFREVRRLLRDDGTAWVNMGDGYAGSWGAQGRDSGDVGRRSSLLSDTQIEAAPKTTHTGSLAKARGLKPKDLIGQPWRLALALQADGWWLRQDIIWHKPNPMPESTRDRCTKAHEYVFLLAKSQRYAYDFKAMQEAVSGGAHARLPGNVNPVKGVEQDPQRHRTRAGLHAYGARMRAGTGVGFGHGTDKEARGRDRVNVPSGWATGTDRKHDELTGRFSEGRKLAQAGSGTKNNASMDEALAVMPLTRNKRTVWTVPTEPFKEAHFATYPPGLIEPCILAGSPVGGKVFDPFGGAATTGLVSDRLQRDAVLCELNSGYADIGERRVTGDAPLFAEVSG